ncbi:hypothetical protein [Aliamphritea hakodatensis]|uniref:hypothetical protein n=1 Tax=Aliamphritea hakodatensis TaxID=2895352 RepID=UPI0022FD9AB0|nr:hypothetical protein [Aliamphritea hakodatensis]
MLQGKRISLIGVPPGQLQRLIALYSQHKLQIVPYGQPADYIIYGSQLESISLIERGTEPIADVMSEEDFFDLLVRSNTKPG